MLFHEATVKYYRKQKRNEHKNERGYCSLCYLTSAIGPVLYIAFLQPTLLRLMQHQLASSRVDPAHFPTLRANTVYLSSRRAAYRP